MEFNFRGWDAQMHHHMYPTPTPLKDGLWSGTSLGGSHGGGMGINFVETRKAIQRELEKERIREEILVEEIARKRDLEAEVRREMAMEMHGGGGGGFPSSFMPRPPLIGHTNRLPPGMPPLAPSSFEERFGGRCEIGRFLHHHRLPGDAKNKVIHLGKANGVTMSGAKGKPGSSEWSCAVCKVSAPCEQAFNAHLAGKKHQAQMAALKAKNTQKQHKTSKKQSGEIGLGVKSTTTMEMESSKSNKSVKTQPPPSKKKNSSNCDSKKEEDKKNSSKCEPKKEEDKKNSSKCDSKKEKDKKSESWFSCEMCNVRASSHEVMNAHIKGKKHLNNLLKLHQESGAAAGPGTKKPHTAKEKPEFGEKDTEKPQVADCESIGSVVVDV